MVIRLRSQYALSPLIHVLISIICVQGPHLSLSRLLLLIPYTSGTNNLKPLLFLYSSDHQYYHPEKKTMSGRGRDQERERERASLVL